jgi:hypothetical protein
MADQQQEAQPQPAEPVVTTVDKSRANREKTFAARQAKAARRLADRHGGDPDKKETPAEAKPIEPEAKAEEKPAEAKPEEKKTEKTPADLDKRYAILERRETKLRASSEKLNERERKVATAESNLQTRYGSPDAIAAAYAKGEYHQMSKALQRWCGDDFAEITRKCARALAGLTPEKLKELDEQEAFKREKREWEQRKAKEEQDRNKGVTREKARQVAAEKCKGHDALKLKNGAELVLKQMEDGWDPDTKGFKLTWRQAADAVVAEKLAEAEALGLKRHAATIVTPEKKPEVKPEVKPTRSEPEVRTKRRSFEERHAEAGRLLAKRRG